MPDNLDLEFERKAWMLRRVKAARKRPSSGPALTQSQAASSITDAFRAAGLLKPHETVLVQSVQQWEKKTSAPTGARFIVLLRWVANRLDEAPPGGMPPIPEPEPEEEKPSRGVVMRKSSRG